MHQPQGSIAAMPAPRNDRDSRHLLLTVLLGSSGATDVPSIVRLTRNLPGVAAAICVKDGLSVAEDGDQTPDDLVYARKLMDRHGAVCLGKDLLTAFCNLETLEHTALITKTARDLGGVKELPAGWTRAL